MSGNIDEEVLDRHKGPAYTQEVPRLEGDLEALQAITQSEPPPPCKGSGERELPCVGSNYSRDPCEGVA